MQLDVPKGPLAALARPQLHSRKCHHTYDATRCLPRAIWVRSLRISGLDLMTRSDGREQSMARDDDEEQDGSRAGDCAVAYEILLYYQHNRACTIYRTPEDVRRLRLGVGPLPSGPGCGGGEMGSGLDGEGVEDVEVLQRYLCEAIKKKKRDCALAYFLRRRMEDCDGCGVGVL